MALLTSFILGIFACNTEKETPKSLVVTAPQQINSDDCDSMLWDYENVGKPYLMTWCTPCHSVDLPEGSRGGSGESMIEAPMGVDFNTYSNVVAWQERIIARIDNGMPPSGGVSEEENLHMLQWLNCGAPE